MDVDATIHKEVSSKLKLNRKFTIKLVLSAIFTAIGIYQHLGSEKLELAFAALVIIPVLGIIFNHLRQNMSDETIRLTVISLASLFVLVTSDMSPFLALAFWMMLDGATQPDSIMRDNAFRWMNAVKADHAPEELSEVFGRHRLFTSIPKENCEKLLEECAYFTFDRNEKLLEEGERNNNLYFIAKGHVRVIKDGVTLAELKQGDIVGEVSALGLSLPLADVVADDRVSAFAVSLDQINELAEEFPEFGKRIFRLAKTRRAELATRHRIEMASQTIYKAVSGHQLFKLLPAHLRHYLVDECKVYEVEKKGLLIRQGEFNSNLYLIADGYVHVVMDGNMLATLGIGDIVGEISVSGINMATADVVAESSVTAYAFASEHIARVADKCPEFKVRLNEIGMLRKLQREEA